MRVSGLLLLLLAVSQRSTGEGTNFCEEQLCSCDLSLHPIRINCDEIGLKSLWEDVDWSATLAALNISGAELLYVTFAGNEIRHVPRLPPLNITFLSFENNFIESIDESAFSNLENLDSLILSNNSLTSDALNEGVFFGKYKANQTGYFPLPVKHLNISLNKIHSIPKNAFDHFPELQTLELSSNPFKTLEGSTKYALSELRKLEYLGLRNTSISSIPEGLLHDLKTLGALDLSYNRFTTVPFELSFTHELMVLVLDGNLFESLDENSFPTEFDKLEDLSVSNCRNLRRIESMTFSSLKSLRKLDISNCPHLKDIDDGAFEGLVSEDNVTSWMINEIYLNNNGLSHIDQALLPWSEVGLVNIQNNPFRCDCNLRWLVLDLLPNLLMIDEPSLTVDLTCSEPSEMKGTSLKSLTNRPEFFDKCSSGRVSSSDFVPSYKDPLSAIAVTVLVIGLLLVIIGASILGFIVVKRRAIAQSLVAPSQIRYERAETEEGSEWKYKHGPSSFN